jgi:hypothetical protein
LHGKESDPATKKTVHPRANPPLLYLDKNQPGALNTPAEPVYRNAVPYAGTHKMKLREERVGGAST